MLTGPPLQLAMPSSAGLHARMQILRDLLLASGQAHDKSPPSQ